MIMADVPLQVVSENAASERRITPSWTISQLKAKLLPVTGIPPISQSLFLLTQSGERIAIESADEESTHLSNFPLSAYAELKVIHHSSLKLAIPIFLCFRMVILFECRKMPASRESLRRF